MTQRAKTYKSHAGGLNFWMHLGCPDKDVKMWHSIATGQATRDLPLEFQNMGLVELGDYYWPAQLLNLWIHKSTSYLDRLEIVDEINRM